VPELFRSLVADRHTTLEESNLGISGVSFSDLFSAATVTFRKFPGGTNKYGSTAFVIEINVIFGSM